MTLTFKLDGQGEPASQARRLKIIYCKHHCLDTQTHTHTHTHTHT